MYDGDEQEQFIVNCITGKVAISKIFRTDDEDFTVGIMFFFSVDSAFYFEMDQEDLGDGYTGDYKKWHNNGRLRTEAKLVEGLFEGKWKNFYDNGNLSREVVYVRGEYKSRKEYYSDGGLRVQIDYLHGEYHGKNESWYRDGKYC